MEKKFNSNHLKIIAIIAMTMLDGELQSGVTAN